MPFDFVRIRSLFPHFEHLFDGSDACDRFLAELANTIGKRSQQLAVHVHRTAAHACHDPGILWFGAVQPYQDHVFARSQSCGQYSEDLDIHRFRLCTLKNGVCHSPQTAVNVVQWVNPCGRRRRPRWDLRRQARRKQKAGGENQAGCFLNAVSHVYRLAVTAAAA